MRLFLLIAFCIYLNAGYTQDASVYKRLNGVPLKRVLKISYTGKEFTYTKDDDNEQLPSPLHDNVFNISNDQKNIMFAWLKFYNPLKYKVNFSVKEIDDPDLVALKTAIDSFQSYTLPAYSVPSSTTLASINNPLKAGSPAPLSDTFLQKAKYFISSIIMSDWINDFMKSVDPTKVDAGVDKYNEIVQVINDIESVENFLYGKVTIEGVENTVVKCVQHRTDDLSGKDKFNDFTSSLSTSEKVVTNLDEKKSRALQAINEISKILTERFNDIAKFLKTGEETRFKTFSAGKRFLLEDVLIDNIEAKSKITDKLKEINKRSKDFLKQFNENGYMTCYVHEFNWEYDKLREYTFTGTSIEVDNTDPKTQSATFTVAKDKGLAIFASTGLFFTPYSFNNFGIQNGLAVSTKETNVYARPAAYLNMMFKRKKGDVLYWLVQVGVSTGNEAPMIPIGAGFVFRNNLSLSVGPLVAWQTKLNGIELNDPVDDAKLKNSIAKKVDLGWYISINYKLGK